LSAPKFSELDVSLAKKEEIVFSAVQIDAQRMTLVAGCALVESSFLSVQP
jgi:hypothetical protein